MPESGHFVRMEEMPLKSYWELNYRGKFIRTLWTTPFAILVIILLLLFSSPISIAASVYLFLLLIAQLVDNYRKWKGKSQPHWQKKMSLMLMLPDNRALVLVIALILIIHILSLLMSYLFPISNGVRMLIEGIAYFFTFLFIFIVIPSGKRTNK